MRDRNFGLDAFRASAILLVLASHVCLYASMLLGRSKGILTLGGYALGYFGVELFFVLSGYLIGGLLIEIVDRGMNPRAWLVFLVRRWLRTLPAYYAWLLVLAVAALGATLAERHFLYVLFLQNLAWPMPGGDWFAVSWSLAIEEWFYLLFSLALLMLTPRLGRHSVPVAITLFLLFPLIARIAFAMGAAGWDNLGDQSKLWDGTIRKVVYLRLDAIAYGVLMASLSSSRARERIQRWRLPVAAIGLALLGLVLLAFFDRPPLASAVWRVWIFPLTSIGFACLFPVGLGLAAPRGLVSDLVRRLSNGSYAIYLVHFSLLGWTFAAAQRGWIPAWSAIPLALAIVFMLAGISYRHFEMPILGRRPRQFGADAPASPRSAPAREAGETHAQSETSLLPAR